MRKIYDHQKTKFNLAELEGVEAALERGEMPQMSVSEIKCSFEGIKSSSYFLKMGGRQSLSMHATSFGDDDICGYLPSIEKIYIAGWGLNIRILCHEVAHHLVCQIAIDIPDHGPTFSAIYLSLLERFGSQALAAEMYLSFIENEIEIDQKLINFKF